MKSNFTQWTISSCLLASIAIVAACGNQQQILSLQSLVSPVNTALVDYASYVNADANLTPAQKSKRLADVADFNAQGATTQPTSSTLPGLRAKMVADIDTPNTDTGETDLQEYVQYVSHDLTRTANDVAVAQAAANQFVSDLNASVTQNP